jgi:hypothetical protein
MSDDIKRELLITRISDGFVRERIDVTGLSEEQIHKRMGGILVGPDFDFKNWLIRDSGFKPE